MALRQTDRKQNDVLDEAIAATAAARPKLVLVHDVRSGPSRRAEAFLAQVLQSHRNHHTFRLMRVDADLRPDLVERLRVKAVPTLLVVEGNRIRARLEKPRGRIAIEAALKPWLR